MLSLLTKVIMAIVVIASGAAVGTVTSGAAGHFVQLNTLPANLTSAEQAALNYVDQHYSGNVTAKILKVENDTENGSAVVDVTVLAPNNNTYDVEVSQASNAVISVELVSHEDQTTSSSDDSGTGDAQGGDNQTGDNQGSNDQSDGQNNDSGNSTQDASTGTDN
ncbi:MAG: PepSY domain-containing protein [Thermoplasmata archaeon]